MTTLLQYGLGLDAFSFSERIHNLPSSHLRDSAHSFIEWRKMRAVTLYLAATALLGAVSATKSLSLEWALETFVELTAVSGDPVQVELRRHCCHSADESTKQFWYDAYANEFKVPPDDCERLLRYMHLTPSANPVCECPKGAILSTDAVAKKLDTVSIEVVRTDLSRRQWVKLAIHDGDFAVLDARLDSICEKLELDVDACSNLSEMMRARSRKLEMKLHKETVLQYSQDSDRIGQVFSSIDRMIDGLLRQIGELRDEVKERAMGYRELQLRSKERIEALERRVRQLEGKAVEGISSEGTKTPPQPETSSSESNLVFRPESLRIPRVRAEKLSYAQYLAFARTSTPVIIQGLGDFPGSPGLPKWTISSLASACGNATVTLKKPRVASSLNATSTEEDLSDWAGIKPVAKATLRHFLRDFASDEPRMMWPFGYADLYLHDASIREFCPEILSEVTIPRYFIDDRLQLLNWSKQASYWPSLFIGDKYTSSALHADWASTAAWMGLISGRKRWTIAKPSAAAALNSIVPTAMSPSQGRFNGTLLGSRAPPLLKPGELFDDVLVAGEVLFIPAGSPHQVQNLEKTIAIAANYVDGVNYEAFHEYLLGEKYSTTGQTSKAHARSLRELERSEGSINLGDTCQEPADLPYSQYKESYRRQEGTASPP